MHRLLRLLAPVSTLRSLALCCESGRPVAADDPVSAHPRRADLLHLLAAQLHVRLVLPRILEEWRMRGWYRIYWRTTEGSRSVALAVSTGRGHGPRHRLRGRRVFNRCAVCASAPGEIGFRSPHGAAV